MFRIREFSRLARVSVKTLRHYDEMGLLEPAFVDPETGYRHYAARQVPRLQCILALRDQGFALEHIRELVGRGTKGTSLAGALRAKCLELERQLDADRRRLDILRARLHELESGAPATLPDVTLSALPPVRVAARRARVSDLDDGIEGMFEKLEAEVAVAGIRASGPPLILYHDRDHRESDADVEVAVPVDTSAGRVGRARVRVLPAVASAACFTYAGGYDRWPELSRSLLAWLQARHLTPAGPLREVFLQFGTATDEDYCIPHAYLVERPEDFVTEMQVPVRAAKGKKR